MKDRILDTLYYLSVIVSQSSPRELILLVLMIVVMTALYSLSVGICFQFLIATL